MSKFNYKSSIITISRFKYLLTFFMDDIGVIRSYLSYFVMQFFMDEQAMPLAAIEYVRHAWVTYFLNF